MSSGQMYSTVMLHVGRICRQHLGQVRARGGAQRRQSRATAHPSRATPRSPRARSPPILVGKVEFQRGHDSHPNQIDRRHTGRTHGSGQSRRNAGTTTRRRRSLMSLTRKGRLMHRGAHVARIHGIGRNPGPRRQIPGSAGERGPARAVCPPALVSAAAASLERATTWPFAKRKRRQCGLHRASGATTFDLEHPPATPPGHNRPRRAAGSARASMRLSTSRYQPIADRRH